MPDLCLLTPTQMAKIKPFFPKSRVVPRVDDRRKSPEGSPNAAEPPKRWTLPRQFDRTKGGLNTKLYALCDGSQLAICLTAGQVSDHIGAKILYSFLPKRDCANLIADKGYGSDEYRAALQAKGIITCVPPRNGRKSPAQFCKS